MVNVWDSITARVVADTPGTTALATASHSIAAARDYEDGEQIPVEEMLEEVRRAMYVGVVGANIEDQLKPLDEAVPGRRERDGGRRP